MESTAAASEIKDISLAPSGQAKIDWVRGHMPVLAAIREDFRREQPFAGKKVAVCLHLEAKTAWFIQVLAEGGALTSACASNPLSTQDDVAAALARSGVEVHARHGAAPAEYERHLEGALGIKPDYIIDDGGDLVHLLHTGRRDLLAGVKGGAEETTTGILRLRRMAAEKALCFPMIAVNDARSKYLFDNRYGTGQSVWDGVMRATNLVVAGKTVCVVGYGWCGKGVALRGKGLGARVVVCEIDPVKANEAWMDGFEVMPMRRAATLADIFITVTGNKNVVASEHFPLMKDGALLANAGHFDVEVDKTALAAMAAGRRPLKPGIEEFTLADGRRLFLLAEGRLVNLAAGDGHPAEVMDMSFALQALTLQYLVDNAAKLGGEVYPVPKDLDDRVSAMRLQALGLEIDALTPEQVAYLASWNV
ncbi:MAG: adenosylhomocysteinase [Gracilibacteraceae bacterium]|jgi:adenosylhomocysteinase|nr:adenosylhomocysteinase [Gracilibacteraceae bacterium]